MASNVKLQAGGSSGTTTITTSETTDRTITIPNATDTLVGKATTDALTNKTIIMPAQTGTIAPLEFTSGTVLATPRAGAFEYDGTCFYSTPLAAARSLSPSTMFSLVASGDWDITEANTAQPAFATTGDVWTLAPSTSYLFEGQYAITRTTTTCTIAMVFALGASATVTSIAYTVLSAAVAANGTPVAPVMTWVNQTATTVVTATTSAATIIRFRGIIRMGAGVGTLTPQIQFSTTTTAALMKVDSYITFTPIGTSTTNILGNVA